MRLPRFEASRAFLAVPLVLAALAASARAQSPVPSAPRDSLPFSPAVKSDLVLPFISAVIPGFGQYWQGEIGSGLAYTAVAAGGLALAVNGVVELVDAGDSTAVRQTDLSPKDWSVRKLLLGAQFYQDAGFLSAYAAFRTAVPAFQYDGEYRFLTPEPLSNVLLAPARFSFLERPTTFIPLGLLAAYVGWVVYDERTGHPGADWTFSADDLAFSGALSYNAGVTEEAAFRGYLLPVLYESTHSFFLSNLLQASLFGLAHYSKGGPIPWPQALLGYYFGYLSHRNQWTISEGIFNHFWWDAMLITGSFIMRRTQVNASFTVPIPAW